MIELIRFFLFLGFLAFESTRYVKIESQHKIIIILLKFIVIPYFKSIFTFATVKVM